MEQTYDELQHRVEELEKELKNRDTNKTRDEISKIVSSAKAHPLRGISGEDIDEIARILNTILEIKEDSSSLVNSYLKNLNEKWNDAVAREIEFDSSIKAVKRAIEIIKYNDIGEGNI